MMEILVKMIKKKFYKYVDAANQALRKLPFTDDVFNNAKFINFEKKETCTFDAVEYFCSKYPKFTPALMDRLQEEFVDYQLLQCDDIPRSIWNEAVVYDDKVNDIKLYRMDTVWGHISTIKNA